MKTNITATFLALLFTSNICFSQLKTTPTKPQLKNHEQIINKNEPPTTNPKGPNGFGEIKIGASKEFIEALSASDGIYLAEPLSAINNSNHTSNVDADTFHALVLTPFNASAVKTTMTFVSNRLTEIFFAFGKSTNFVEQINHQITEKYGPGTVDDKRKDEQCIYRNGANFKINTGTISTEWIEDISESEFIKTRTSNYTIEFCPGSLTSTRYPPATSQSMTISKITKVKRKNIF